MQNSNHSSGPQHPAKPGVYDIRPTREDGERDNKSFFKIVHHRRKTHPLKDIGYALGDRGEQPAVSAIRALKKESATEQQRIQALRHFFEDVSRSRKELRAIPAAFYNAFLDFANVRETSQDKARARSIGSYRFWRQSVEHPDEYISGKIVLSEDPETGALEANMVQRRRPTPGHDVAEERFTGHLFRVSHLYLMILRDVITNDLRVTFFTHRRESYVGTDINPRSPFRGRIAHNVSLDGHVFGVDGGKRFFAPLHLALVDNVDELAGLDDTLDIVPEDKVPERVLKKLKSMGRLQEL